MKTLYLFPAAISLLLLGACSPRLTTFTQDLYKDFNWTDADLKKVQFYLSDDLTLSRNADEESGVNITGGEIRIIDGKKVEQIHFRAGTPGVFLYKPKSDHFAISFEDGDETKYLVFGPNPKYDGRYMLLASEWNRSRGKVTYAGQKFYTDSNVIPRLLVDLKQSGYRKTESRTVKGRRIGN